MDAAISVGQLSQWPSANVVTVPTGSPARRLGGRAWKVLHPDHQQMLEGIRALLDRAGFQAQASGRGITVESVPEGVRVSWQPDLALLGPVASIK